MKKFFVVFFLISFLLLLVPVFAQQFAYQDFFNPEYLWKEVLGMPEEWVQPRLFLFNFTLPLIGLFAIVLGFMRAMHIFETQDTVQIVIAFIMVFLTLPSKIFITFVQYTFGFGAVFAYVMFLVMFIGGAYFTTKGIVFKQQAAMRTVGNINRMLNNTRQQYDSLINERNILRNEITSLVVNKLKEKDETKKQKIEDSIQDTKNKLTELKTDIGELEDKMEELRRSKESLHI